MFGRSRGFVVALVLALLPALAVAQPEHRTQRVKFKDGRTTIEGRIKGRQYVDYVFPAGAGESLKVRLETSNYSNYFNLLAPGETDVAFFVGSSSGNSYEGVAPTSGDYEARVYLMRNSARRGGAANYTLTIYLGKTSATDEKGPDFADGLTGARILLVIVKVETSRSSQPQRPRMALLHQIPIVLTLPISSNLTKILFATIEAPTRSDFICPLGDSVE